MEDGLAIEQVEQLDCVDKAIYDLLCSFAGYEIPWDMEIIGEVADEIAVYFAGHFGISEAEFRPYIQERKAQAEEFHLGDFVEFSFAGPVHAETVAGRITGWLDRPGPKKYAVFTEPGGSYWDVKVDDLTKIDYLSEEDFEEDEDEAFQNFNEDGEDATHND